MTINEAITQIDSLKVNTYTPADKIGWLSRADNMIKKNIIDTHEGGEAVQFAGYTEETDPETVLLVPEPYDELYIRYLETQIDYTNGEYAKYNNSILMFNAAYEAYASYYNRNHMPKSGGTRFLF